MTSLFCNDIWAEIMLNLDEIRAILRLGQTCRGHRALVERLWPKFLARAQYYEIFEEDYKIMMFYEYKIAIPFNPFREDYLQRIDFISYVCPSRGAPLRYEAPSGDRLKICVSWGPKTCAKVYINYACCKLDILKVKIKNMHFILPFYDKVISRAQIAPEYKKLLSRAQIAPEYKKLLSRALTIA